MILPTHVEDIRSVIPWSHTRTSSLCCYCLEWHNFVLPREA